MFEIGDLVLYHSYDNVVFEIIKIDNRLIDVKVVIANAGFHIGEQFQNNQSSNFRLMTDSFLHLLNKDQILFYYKSIKKCCSNIKINIRKTEDILKDWI